MNGLKIAKTAVFILTLLIFSGLFLCFYLIHQKTSAVKINNVSDINLNEPVGSNIKNVVAEGKDLYIIVQDGGKSDRIVVFSGEKRQAVYNIIVN